MSPLHALRERLDTVDRQLIEALAERQRLVTEVAEVKAGEGALQLRDPEREDELLARLHKQAEEYGLDGFFVSTLYRRILAHSVRYQAARLNGKDDAPLVVAYQGVDGSYSHAAARQHFAAVGQSVVYHGYGSFSAAVDALARGEADRAFLPIENTSAGSIHETYDLLGRADLSVVGEEVLRVEHCLLALESVPLGRIRRIGSHPQALAQCSHFLEALRDCRVEEEDDTAGAARRVAESGDLSRGAIASEEAASRYGLVVVKRNVANRKDNFTRFVVLSREAETFDARLAHKTSLVMTTDHRHGALAQALGAFARHGVNLTKLESRPVPETPWRYRFYFDIEGGPHEPTVEQALAETVPHVASLRVLGAYPRWTEDAESQARLPLRAEAAAARPAAPVVIVDKATSKNKLGSRTYRAEDTIVEIGGVVVGGEHPVIIAGPCSVESTEQIMESAKAVREAGGHMLRGGCFKPRTSPYDFQGLGFEGLSLLHEAGRAYGLPIVTEVLHPADVEAVAREADVLQIGARNMQNFELLKAVGRARVPVLLKRGLMASVDEWLAAAEYVLAQGNARVILCERGIRTFETATRNTLDLSAVPVLRERTHLPIIVDPSHAAGIRRWVPALSMAALAAGAHGVMIEVHPDPDNACSDGPQSLDLPSFAELAGQLLGRTHQVRAA
jgi:chorismate mutase / prephenate dehydratase